MDCFAIECNVVAIRYTSFVVPLVVHSTPLKDDRRSIAADYGVLTAVEQVIDARRDLFIAYLQASAMRLL